MPRILEAPEPETGTKTKYMFLIINHNITSSNLSPLFLFKLLPPLFTVWESTSPVSLNYFYWGRRNVSSHTAKKIRGNSGHQMYPCNSRVRTETMMIGSGTAVVHGAQQQVWGRAKQNDGWTSQWCKGHKAREQVEGLRSVLEMEQDHKTKPWDVGTGSSSKARQVEARPISRITWCCFPRRGSDSEDNQTTTVFLIRQGVLYLTQAVQQCPTLQMLTKSERKGQRESHRTAIMSPPVPEREAVGRCIGGRSGLSVKKGSPGI